MTLWGDVMEDTRRLCKVKDEYGYFHCWEQFTQYDEQHHMPTSLIFGVVEFKDGVNRVPLADICFIDEQNAVLHMLGDAVAKGYTDAIKDSEVKKNDQV